MTLRSTLLSAHCSPEAEDGDDKSRYNQRPCEATATGDADERDNDDPEPQDAVNPLLPHRNLLKYYARLANDAHGCITQTRWRRSQHAS